jgi:AcrR family transcriptional regulator
MPEATGPVGRREQHKIATRRAIEDAARRLFDAHGYQNVTVREIAAAAGVTERTFFRYFGDKAELIVDDVLAWLPALRHLVRSQPATMSPQAALRSAFLALHEHNADAAGLPTFITLFSEGPPGPRIAATRRWSWFTTVMDALVTALLEREQAVDDETRYRIEVVVWVTVAVFRTALVRQWELRSSGAPVPSVADLVRRAFDELGAG